MTSKAPPIPSENQSPKGTGGANTAPVDQTQHGQTAKPYSEEQGRHGNIKENTTHQGYQQDR
ncbi:hypothetical protein [Mangrovicella endophytica]|uniref:hypothetical protein n=1 Tax=Mangrovicella endophytica TaxID=2066697 RepID=UPI000C9EAD8B|nr:hypothetical protein [Mangrovicella endophytica]